MIFTYFSTVASMAQICRKSDFVRLINSPAVEAAIKSYRSGNQEAKKGLPAFCFHASFRQGKRKSADAIPSGLFMLDFDHLSPDQLRRIIGKAIPQPEKEATSPILLVHITPSGNGLRIVAKATRNGDFSTCNSLKSYQNTLAKQLEASDLLDEVCTDLARLSFCPMARDVLYLSDRLFDEQPEVTEFSCSAVGDSRPFTPATLQVAELFPDSQQEEYEGVRLSDIFLQYIELTGGIPAEGSRNSRYYAAARDLRYICDFNARVVSRFLPDCGLSQSEIFQLCVSACQSSRATRIPDVVLQALEAARQVKASEEEDIAPEPDSATPNQHYFIPSLAREFLKISPVDFHEATLLCLLPVVGTLSTRVRAKYLDGEVHSPSFFTIVSSEQASGKSFARRIVRILLHTIAEEDAQQREIEQKFKEELKLKKNAKQQPTPPRTKIRLVPASISVAKLLQRLEYAEEEHLFSFAEEMDTLIKTNKSGAWSEKNDIYRNAFDNAEYGQDFMSENSWSVSLRVFYNLLVLGTPRQTERFFSDVENGLASRCCFATLPDQFGAKMPQWKDFEEKDLKRIEHQIRTLRAAHGEIDLSFLYPTLEGWLEEQRILALEQNNRARDIFRRRSAVIAFRAVLAFSPLYKLSGGSNRDKLSHFALLIANLVLKNQMRFAGAKLNQIVESSVTPAKTMFGSIFDSLADDFTPSEVNAEMRKRGMKTPVKQLIWHWTKNGLIEKIAVHNFRKIKHGNND